MVREQTLELQRAADALKKVEEVEKRDEKFKKDYVNSVASLPATILMSGLGQAAATLLAAAGKKKEEDAHGLLYRHLEAWLCRNDQAAPYPNGAGLMKAITSNDRDHYLHAQEEAMAWLTWLKKFATAYLKKE